MVPQHCTSPDGWNHIPGTALNLQGMELKCFWYGVIGCFPDGSDGKESACNAGDIGSIPGLGRCLEEENGYPLQYSCLENSMDRGAWRATVQESQT